MTSNSIWSNLTFKKLYWAHVVSLLGSGISSVALGLLAHALVGSSVSEVLGYTLTIRIVVIVIFSPWAGYIGQRFGARSTMIWSDLIRLFIVASFYFVNAVWQIYLLAILLNIGSALFTPVYKAVIPGVVKDEEYPKALAFGSVAYDISSILGPALAGLLIATIGFRGSFLVDAGTFFISAVLVFAIPRFAIDIKKTSVTRTPPWYGIGAMFRRSSLRESLFLALQVSVAGAFVLVATIDFVKNDLSLPDRYYAWAMAVYGSGSVAGALIYSYAKIGVRDSVVTSAAIIMIVSLALVAISLTFPALLVAWFLIGAMQSSLGVRGSELLASNSNREERSHIYAAHFALSHAGWGLTYPLAGYLTSNLNFTAAAWTFTGMLTVVSIPFWFLTLNKAIKDS